MIFCKQILTEIRIVTNFSCEKESCNMICYMLHSPNRQQLSVMYKNSKGPPSTIISTTSVDSQWCYWWTMWVDWAWSPTVWAQRWPSLSASSHKQQRLLWRHQRRDSMTLGDLLYAIIDFWRFAYAAWPCVRKREYHVTVLLLQIMYCDSYRERGGGA